MGATLGGQTIRTQKMSDRNGRITLGDNLQFQWFAKAMNILNHNKSQLSQYDLELYRKMRDGWDFSGRELTITVKQMNHLMQVAQEMEEGIYNGR
ncbi:MAG: hypothetical protein ACRCZI_09820 [Cetobacterium sp.]